MNKKSEMIRKKSSLLQKFMDATEAIQAKLELVDDEESIKQLQSLVEVRENVIGEITKIDQYIEPIDKDDARLVAEYEKHSWLWVQLLEQLETLEVENAEKMQAVVEKYMKKVRSTKDSIKAIDAYGKQMVDTDAISIDKNR